MVVPGLLLIIVLGLLSQSVQAGLRSALYHRRALILAGPLLLTAIFSAAAWNAGAASLPLSMLVLAYTLAPTLCVMLPRGAVGVAHWADMAGILLLWLPLEFAAGASLVPKPAQGYLHAVAYGVAIVLALWLFLIYRGMKGVKYNLPCRRQDFLYPAIGFAVLAPVLGLLGLLLGFLGPMHAPRVAAYKLVLRYLVDILRHCAARRNPVPWLDSELDHAAFRRKRLDSPGCGLHLRLLASQQRPAARAQLALYDSGDHRGRRLWQGVSKVFEYSFLGVAARRGGHGQICYFLIPESRFAIVACCGWSRRDFFADHALHLVDAARPSVVGICDLHYGGAVPLLARRIAAGPGLPRG